MSYFITPLTPIILPTTIRKYSKDNTPATIAYLSNLLFLQNNINERCKRQSRSI